MLALCNLGCVPFKTLQGLLKVFRDLFCRHVESVENAARSVHFQLVYVPSVYCFGHVSIMHQFCLRNKFVHFYRSIKIVSWHIFHEHDMFVKSCICKKGEICGKTAECKAHSENHSQQNELIKEKAVKAVSRGCSLVSLVFLCLIFGDAVMQFSCGIQMQQCQSPSSVSI